MAWGPTLGLISAVTRMPFLGEIYMNADTGWTRVSSNRKVTTYRVVRHLLGDVVALRAVGVVVRATEELVQHRVVRLLDTVSRVSCVPPRSRSVWPPSVYSPTGLDVPSGQVEREDVHEAVTRVGLLSHSVTSAALSPGLLLRTHPKIRSGWEKKSVMRSRSERGSSTNVGSAILVRSMPGRTGGQLALKYVAVR